ncbi:MAG: AraC family transcriptional regulator [Victivallaceae bacterium]|nr:AraC family transcriptional regulator [Victivallaceae bacterium]
MDKTTLDTTKIFVSEIFRTPLSAEREIGLWIDRIGVSGARPKTDKLRILGLYAAVGIESGSGFYYSEAGGKIPVSAGDTMIVFPDIPHRYFPEPKWETRFVVWNGPEAVKLERLGFLSREQLVIPASASAVVEANKALLEIIHREDLGSILARKNIALEMILNLHCGRLSEGKHKHTDSQIDRAVSYMHNNYTGSLSVSECAAGVNMSESHFRRLFKQRTGRSPKEFILALRISKAKALLSRGESIKRTAEQVGWDDEFYFMRIFRKVCGISPGKFRR